MDEKRVTGESNKVAGQVQGAVGDLTGDTKTQAEGALREARGTAENLVGQAKDAASRLADQTADLAQDALRRGRQGLPGADEVYRRGNEAVRPYTQDAPLGALLGAVAVGYLLGYLIHGRR
ncbi:CsbD family protein [Methylobacterium sp. WSM2598]|uniref:CsbD family protein n=1 Tax=Methylobacterium sp. WSM2598 TaxID=398261 RepID=UPI00035C25F7|nr:CsbD family protein [Methylobacterium sp. WSM2598]